MPIGFPATIAIITAHVPSPTAPNRTPAFAKPKKNNTTCTGYLNARSKLLSASRASGEASMKRPASRAACGRKGMIGTSAIAGCRPS